VTELVHLDAASVDAVAQRVVELLRDDAAIASAAPELLTAAEVARRYRVDRSWVYSHATELGALRLGDGRKPRLRFDPQRVRQALDARSPSEGSRTGEVPARAGVRAVDVSRLVPEPADVLPQRWREAAGLEPTEASR
jgi:hypothetical protein